MQTYFVTKMAKPSHTPRGVFVYCRNMHNSNCTSYTLLNIVVEGNFSLTPTRNGSETKKE